MVSQPSSFSTYDYSRGRNNSMSRRANPSDFKKRWDRNTILQMIESRGTWGLTSAEIDDQLGNPGKNFFSGRLSELFRSEQIVKNGQRTGCTVYIHAKFKSEVR